MYKCAKKPVPFHPTKHYKFAQGYKVNFILSRMDIKIFRKTSKYAIHINLKKTVESFPPNFYFLCILND